MVSTTLLFYICSFNMPTHGLVLGNPLNILGVIPTVALDYSLLWSFELFTWTGHIIKSDIRARLTGEFGVVDMAAAGRLTSPNGGPLEYNKISNCPIIHRFM